LQAVGVDMGPLCVAYYSAAAAADTLVVIGGGGGGGKISAANGGRHSIMYNFVADAECVNAKIEALVRIEQLEEIVHANKPSLVSYLCVF
jgi:hypothetical protein